VDILFWRRPRKMQLDNGNGRPRHTKLWSQFEVRFNPQ
jgi:hypothetical protein